MEFTAPVEGGYFFTVCMTPGQENTKMILTTDSCKSMSISDDRYPGYESGLYWPVDALAPHNPDDDDDDTNDSPYDQSAERVGVCDGGGHGYGERYREGEGKGEDYAAGCNPLRHNPRCSTVHGTLQQGERVMVRITAFEAKSMPFRLDVMGPGCTKYCEGEGVECPFVLSRDGRRPDGNVVPGKGGGYSVIIVLLVVLLVVLAAVMGVLCKRIRKRSGQGRVDALLGATTTNDPLILVERDTDAEVLHKPNKMRSRSSSRLQGSTTTL